VPWKEEFYGLQKKLIVLIEAANPYIIKTELS
jgi:hypothetical protein